MGRLTASIITSLVLLIAVACGADSADAPELTGAAEQGRRLYNSSGCASCHGRNAGGGVGPSLIGIVGEERELTDGSTVVADEEYLRRSIREPRADVVAGYSVQMPSNNLSDDEISAVVEYIKALDENAEESSP